MRPAPEPGMSFADRSRFRRDQPKDASRARRASLRRLTLEALEDRAMMAAPPAPLAPDLQAASDTGRFSDDNVTSATLVTVVGGFPQFDVSQVTVGATVELFRNGTLVDSKVAASTGPITLIDSGPTFIDGVYLYKARQADSGGNSGAFSPTLSVTIDNTAPQPPAAPVLQAASDSGASSTDNVTNVTAPTFDIPNVGSNVTLNLLRDGVLVQTLVAVGPGTVSIQDPGPVSSGAHNYSSYAVDLAGNVSPISGALQITIDTSKPIAPNIPDLQDASDSGLSSTDNITNVAQPFFDVTAAEFAATVQLFRDGKLVGSRIGPGEIQDLGPITEGIHNYTSNQIDQAGNVGALSLALPITMDTIALSPGLPVLDAGSDSGVLGDNITNSTNPVFDISGVEAGASVNLYRDGTLVSTRVSTTNVQDPGPVPDGFHAYQIDQTDVAGNVSTHSRTLNVQILATIPSIPSAPDLQPLSDTPLPAAPTYIAGVTDSDNNTALNTLNFTVVGPDGVSTVQLLRSGSVVASRIGTGTVSDTVVLDGVYSYTTRILDPAGNLSSASGTLVVIVDTLAPDVASVPNLQPGSDSGTSNTDNITSNTAPTFDVVQAEATATVQLLRNGTVVASRFGPGAIADPGPLMNGIYLYTSRQIDLAGNFGPISTALPVTIDTTIPGVPNAPDLQAASDSGISQTDNVTNVVSPTFNITGIAPDATAQLYRKVKGSDLSTYVLIPRSDSPVAAGNVAITDPGLLADGEYDYAVRQVAPAGGTSAFSPILTIKIDTQAIPVITPVLANPLGSQAVTTVARKPKFSGTTEAGATVTLLLDTGSPAVPTAIATTIADLVGNFTIQAPNSLMNGQYTFRLQVSDTAGNIPTGGSQIGSPLTVTVMSQANDFDADGKADISVYRPGLLEGQWFIQQSTAGPRAYKFGGNGDIPLQGDFDGDGKADFAVFRPSTAQWFIQQSSAGPRAVQFGAANLDIPVTGDFDGDGKTDLAVYRPGGTGQWFIMQSTGGPRYQSFGGPGDIPVPADFDGDHKTDFAVFRPSTSQWFILQSTAGPRVGTLGSTGDVPVPADYDGDGKADLATYRPSSSQWFIQQSATSTTRVDLVGLPGDVPVPSDYDGDGKADLATFKRSTAVWSISQSTLGPRIVQFGASNLDIPIPSPFSYRSPSVGTLRVAGSLGGSSGGAVSNGASLNFGQQAASLAADLGVSAATSVTSTTKRTRPKVNADGHASHPIITHVVRTRLQHHVHDVVLDGLGSVKKS
jgi:hypothetical protein